MLTTKIRKINFRHPYEARPVPILGHAAATMPEAMGSLVPILILDTTERPDIEEYVRLHKTSGAGDVETQWGRRPDKSSIYQLLLTVIRPAELLIYLELPFPESISIIDHIVQSKRACIQPGKPGDRLSTTYETASRVIMEVPETGFGRPWNSTLHRHFERVFRKQGARRKDAKIAAENFIRERRNLLDYKMRGL